MDQMTSTILMLVVLFGMMYFLMIRPENKRKKAAQQMRDSLKKGDIITTIGGIVAKIVSVQQDTIIVETSEDRVRMEFTKWAVSTVGVQTGEQPEAKKKEKQPEEIPAEVPEEPAEDTKELFVHKNHLPWNMLIQSIFQGRSFYGKKEARSSGVDTALPGCSHLTSTVPAGTHDLSSTADTGHPRRDEHLLGNSGPVSGVDSHRRHSDCPTVCVRSAGRRAAVCWSLLLHADRHRGAVLERYHLDRAGRGGAPVRTGRWTIGSAIVWAQTKKEEISPQMILCISTKIRKTLLKI